MGLRIVSPATLPTLLDVTVCFRLHTLLHHDVVAQSLKRVERLAKP